MKLKLKKYEITVRESITLPHRTKPEPLDRIYTVRAKTEKSALSSIRDAGIKGRIIKIENINPQRHKKSP